ENYFYRNTGKGTFESKGLMMGMAFGEHGQGTSSMGPAVGDVDLDGKLDIFVPDMGYGSLLMNRGKSFDDLITVSRLAVICGQYTGWGAVLFDYDNDTDLDVYVSNGNAHHEYPEEDVLAANDGKGKFSDVARGAGPYFAEKHVGRGATYGDYDNDGDLDLLIVNLNGAAKLLRNDGGNRGHWLEVRAMLPGGLSDAIGARVTATLGERKLVREVNGATGYLSQADLRAHFGLGSVERVDQVEIRWPDRSIKRLKNVPADQLLTVVQGEK
ncbi:MAG: CRTAC1 family protein, partial [Actinomycetia bacterium]|nr:CRTAC1 family protein [Actinomycetes bacterium]